MTPTEEFVHESAHQWECLVQCDPKNTLVREIQKHYCSHLTRQENTGAEKITLLQVKGNTK